MRKVIVNPDASVQEANLGEEHICIRQDEMTLREELVVYGATERKM